MSDAQRGEIRNRQYVQIVDFSGLRWGKITPTDIDGFIDFGNKLFIYIELKYGDAQLPYGQRLALERVANAVKSVPVVVLVAEHHATQDEDIDAASSIVRQYYHNRRWITPRRRTTTLQAINLMLRFYGLA